MYFSEFISTIDDMTPDGGVTVKVIDSNTGTPYEVIGVILETNVELSEQILWIKVSEEEQE